MKWIKWTLSLVLLFTMLNSSLGIANADSPAPRINPQLPRPPEYTADVVADNYSVTNASLNLPALKAVLIVGGIDGDTGYWTTKEINNMKLAETILRQNGVSVTTFYAPNNNWAQIKAAAQGAHFLFYRGHGIEWGTNPLIVGGFALSDGKNGWNFISNDMIRNDIRLAPNAIVMLYGCYATGSYGDEVTLTSAEAIDRVYQYADPFFDVGAGGYFANWWGDAFEKFLTYLFAGQTMGQAYQSFYDYNPATVEKYPTFPTRPDLAMWLDKDFYSGGWKYNNAFVGKPSLTFENLFSTQMVTTPNPLTLLTTPPSNPVSRQVVINNNGTITFQWQANLGNVTWAKLSSTSGTSGSSITITLDPDGLKAGVYQTNLTISTSTPGVVPGMQVIPVKLVVVDQIHTTFLPVTIR